SFFSGIKPARTTVQSVLSDGIKVEIDAIARVSREQIPHNPGTIL
ncbi:MAG TPA: RidA family protein, partial [Chryseosolibacter sp.]|nr:RidA family protein [Chryseosolibacter sp.]